MHYSVLCFNCRSMSSPAVMCHNVLNDTKLFTQLRQRNFDYGVIDGLPFNQCLYILLYKLGLKYSTMTVHIDPNHMGNPVLPSFVVLPTAYPRSTKMDFWERVQNFWEITDWCFDNRYT